MSYNTQTKAELDGIIEKIITEVETAGSWVKPFKAGIAGGIPTSTATGKTYSGINIFNLWAIATDRGYNSSKWATFKQIKTAGNKVKKGEKGSPVFFFKPIKIEDADGEEKTIPYLKKYTVFNLEQTEQGDPTAVTPEAVDEIETIATAEEFYSNLDYLTLGRGQPSYNPQADQINIPSIQAFISSGEYYSTLGHEYIHSTGHSTRNNRAGITSKTAKFGSDAYAYEELIAELGSVLLMGHLKITDEPTQDNSKAYLKSWLRKLKDDPKQLWKASSEATKALKYLLEAEEISREKKELKTA